MKMKRSFFAWFVVITLIAIACSCPGLPGGLGEIQEGIDMLEELATEMPIEGLEQTAISLATEMPAEEMLDMAEGMMTEVPVDLLDPEAMLQTAEAGGIPDVFGDQEDQGAPPDIPVLDNKNDDFYGSRDVVTYSTTVPFTDVVNFYKQEMLNHGWQEMPGDSVEMDEVAMLQYDKPERSAMVTLSKTEDGGAQVNIMINPK